LAVKLWSARNATGVSYKTLQLYALVRLRERGDREGGREGGPCSRFFHLCFLS